MCKRGYLLAFIFLCSVSFSFAQPVGYYNDAAGKKGAALKSALNEIIRNHVDFSYNASRNIINYADADPDNPDNVILFYSQVSRSAARYGTGGDYINREHVWAKSHGNFSGIRPMDSDVHNLHAADASVNEDRSNKDFDNIQPLGTQHSEATTCYFTDSTWEPGPETKGQVARVLLYMSTRYEGTGDELDLEAVAHNRTYPKPEHGNLKALLEWNRQYPPTDFERRRNERVFRAQRNRNPFVDHPEFVDLIWSDAELGAVGFSDFEMTPKVPVPGDDVTVAIAVDGLTETDQVSFAWGDEYDSEDHEMEMSADGNVFSATFTPDGFGYEDMMYMMVKVATADSVYSWPASYLFPENIEASSIESLPEVQGDGAASQMAGQEVTLAGRVTANFDYAFYLETGDNELAGINVYNTIFRGKVGDSIIVRGTVDEYKNLTELADVSYLYNYQDNVEMEPKLITTAGLGEANEGMLVTLKSVSFGADGGSQLDENSSYGFTDSDGSGVIYVSTGARVAGVLLPFSKCDITGVLSQYEDMYQLLLRDGNDIKLATGIDNQLVAKKKAIVYPNPASTMIYFNVKRNVKAIEVRNLNGQCFYQENGMESRLDVSGFPQGVYVVKVLTADDKLYIDKFIKQ